MAELTIKIPDAMKEFLDHKAQENKFAGPSDYALALLADAIRLEKKRQLEKELLECLDEYERGECTEVTPEFWQKLREDYSRKYAKS